MILSAEKKNFMKACGREPILLYDLFCYLGKAGLAFCKRKITKAGLRTSQRQMVQLSANYRLKEQIWIVSLPASHDEAISEAVEIKLASTVFKVEDVIDWGHGFDDAEDTFALNRFGWLLVLLLQAPSKGRADSALRWILQWIETMGQEQSHPCWESYSVSERLSNWPFILSIANALTEIPDDAFDVIEASLLSQMNFLADNLEYHGEFTNNHILNNARGLYIGGTVLEQEEHVALAKSIFQNWTKQLFFPDGMLKEQSSHYQYLMCQRYEQILHIAKNADDRNFEAFLEAWLLRIDSARRFFSIRSKDRREQIPYLGDISPDFPPSFLLGGEDGGWSSLKQWLGWNAPFAHPPNSHRSFEEKMGGFVRYDCGDIAIFWHAQTDRLPCNTHAHYDFGSFILFYKGQPIFGDPGRVSYTDQGSFGKGATAHTSVTIDELGPFCEDTRLNFLPHYRTGTARYCSRLSDAGFILEMAVDGFSRLEKPVLWKRVFEVERGGILISDHFEGVGRNAIRTAFQIESSVEVINETQRVILALGNENFMTLACNPAPLGMQITESVFSKAYGDISHGQTISFFSYLDNKLDVAYEIRW